MQRHQPAAGLERGTGDQHRRSRHRLTPGNDEQVAVVTFVAVVPAMEEPRTQDLLIEFYIGSLHLIIV